MKNHVPLKTGISAKAGRGEPGISPETAHGAASVVTPQPEPMANIHTRTTRARKSAYVRAAYPMPLAKWMLLVLDAAAKYQTGKIDEENA